MHGTFKFTSQVGDSSVNKKQQRTRVAAGTKRPDSSQKIDLFIAKNEKDYHSDERNTHGIKIF